MMDADTTGQYRAKVLIGNWNEDKFGAQHSANAGYRATPSTYESVAKASYKQDNVEASKNYFEAQKEANNLRGDISADQLFGHYGAPRDRFVTSYSNSFANVKVAQNSLHRTSLIEKKREEWMKDPGNTREIYYTTASTDAYTESSSSKAQRPTKQYNRNDDNDRERDGDKDCHSNSHDGGGESSDSGCSSQSGCQGSTTQDAHPSCDLQAITYLYSDTGGEGPSAWAITLLQCGVVRLRGVYAAADVQAAKAKTLDYVAEHPRAAHADRWRRLRDGGAFESPPSEDDGLRWEFNLPFLHPFSASHWHHRPALRRMIDLHFGGEREPEPSYYLEAATCIITPPGVDAQDIHADSYAFGRYATRRASVTVTIPLSKGNALNGALHVCPRTHLDESVYRDSRESEAEMIRDHKGTDASDFGRVQAMAEERRKLGLCFTCETDPGDVCVYDNKLQHWGGASVLNNPDDPNHQNDPLSKFAWSFVEGEATWNERVGGDLHRDLASFNHLLAGIREDNYKLGILGVAPSLEEV